MSESNNGSLTLLRCPACKTKVVVQRPSGEIAILQRAIIVRQGTVFAACSRCKKEIPVEALSYKSQSIVVRESQEKSQDKGLTSASVAVTIET